MITNGYDNGLVQLVGQIIYRTKIRKPDRKPTALALCKWGGVKNAHQLIQKKEIKFDQVDSTQFSLVFFLLFPPF